MLLWLFSHLLMPIVKGQCKLWGWAERSDGSAQATVVNAQYAPALPLILDRWQSRYPLHSGNLGSQVLVVGGCLGVKSLSLTVWMKCLKCLECTRVPKVGTAYHLWRFERVVQKSLPASLFQREERFLGIKRRSGGAVENFNHLVYDSLIPAKFLRCPLCSLS